MLKDIQNVISKVNVFGYFYTNNYINSSKYTKEIVKMYKGNNNSAGKFIGELVKSIIYSLKEEYILHKLKIEKSNVYFRIN